VNLKESANSRFLLGAAYGKLERYSEAVSHLKKYLIHAPPQDPRRQRAEGALRFYQSQIK
jgi:cytochrome c-type biogenesis protein CcmH/NrfG